MTEQLGFSLSDTGIVLSCFGVGAMLESSLGGWLTDKKGHFTVQLFSLLLSAPIFFILPLLHQVYSLGIGIFVLSTIAETFRPANSVSIATYSKKENLTRAFSLNRMALNLGFSIGPALGGLLAAISYQLLFYGNGLSVMLAGVVFYWYFRYRQNGSRKSSPNKIKTSKVKGGVSPWKDKRFLAFSVLCCFYSISFFQLLSTLPIYYRDVHLLSESNVGLLLAFNGIVVFGLEMLLVQWVERFMNFRTIIVSGVLFLFFAFFSLSLNIQSHWVLYLSMFLLSISEILAMPFMASLTAQRAHSSRQDAYMGLNALTFSVAHVFSPLLGTYVAQHYGFSNLWLFTSLLCVITSLGMFVVLKKF